MPFCCLNAESLAKHRVRIKNNRWLNWHEPGISEEEKRLILKLDVVILIYGCLTFWVKYLDQTNVTNAYVSGMKEDLGLFDNELSWFNTYFNIGIILGGPFFTGALTVIRPRYWLPSCTIAWSFFVLFIYKAQNARTIYILRFFAGIFESGAMPGAFYMIGSWYRKSEMSRRSTLLVFSSIGASMFSGYIQAGLHRNMDGRLGLQSWRWLFILDFILGIPIALFGFLCCPDEPKAPKPWWMTESEQEIAIARMASENRDATKPEWNKKALRRILCSWQLSSFCLAWGLMQLTCGANLQAWMTLYLKSLKADGVPKYSTTSVNVLPTVVGAVEFVWMIISAIIADRLRKNAVPIFVLGVVQLYSYIVFLVWSSNEAFMKSTYYIASAYGAISPLLGAWLNSSCGGDKQLRAFTTSLMISVGYAVETPVQQMAFPTSQAPRYLHTHGYVLGTAAVASMIAWCCIMLPLIEYRFRPRSIQ